MTSVSLDKADVEEEMDEAVEARLDEVVEEGAVEEAGVTAATGGKGCEMDRFNPSLSVFAGVWLRVVVPPLPLAALAACLDRKEPGLRHEGTSSSVSITWPDCDVGEDGNASTSVLGGGGGREGGPVYRK